MWLQALPKKQDLIPKDQHADIWKAKEYIPARISPQMCLENARGIL